MWFFYLPVYVVYLWYALRSRSMIFFSAANPAMEMGGFVDYSKWDILSKIDQKYLPIGACFQLEEKEKVADWIERSQLSYPLILKPDRGERGFLVEKINDPIELATYLTKIDRPFIVQEFIDYEYELGIMYYRMPDSNRGHIYSIVRKEFLSVVGDGSSTLKALFLSHDRTMYHYDMLIEMYHDELELVLNKGERKELVSIGNHCRGTTFLDANYLNSEELEKVFDAIAIPIKGFNFGRFDLRVSSIEDLMKGENIKIIELNGANSEPAHIYDPEMSLLEAYRVMAHHWKISFLVSRENHKKGVRFDPLWQSYLKLRNHVKSK